MKIRVLFTLFIVLQAYLLYAQKDTIQVFSGDILVGEFKGLNNNIVTFGTDYDNSDFKINWDKIARVYTEDEFIILTADGSMFNGSLKPVAEEAGVCVIVSGNNRFKMKLKDIVETSPIKQSFVDKVTLLLDAGYLYTKANNVHQLSFSGSFHYISEKWIFSGEFSKITTVQDSVPTISRLDGKSNALKRLYGNSFYFIGVEFLQNSEQKLDLRTTTNTGVGFYFLRNNKFYLLGALGGALTNENYSDDTTSSKLNSIEGYFGIALNAFNLKNSTILLRCGTYPSISEWGRYRINFDFSIKYDLPFNIYIKSGYSHNFDSDPLIDVSRNDYIFTTSIGWEWNKK